MEDMQAVVKNIKLERKSMHPQTEEAMETDTSDEKLVKKVSCQEFCDVFFLRNV